jgi:hypothetical protein
MAHKYPDEEDPRAEAESFTADVDRLFNGQSIAETNDEAYQADLELAGMLSRANFVPESSYKTRLHSQLTDKLYQTKEIKPMFPKILRSVMVTVVAALLLFGVVFAASPEARAATQQFVSRFVEVKSPWALLPEGQSAPASAPGQEIDTSKPAGVVVPGGNLPASPSGENGALPVSPSGAVPQSRGSIDLNNLVSLETAQANLDFTILVPSSLPDGYTFKGVMPTLEAPTVGLPSGDIQPPADMPKMKAPQIAILVFTNANNQIITLSEQTTGNIPADVPLPAGPDSTQDVTINGQPAQYIEGHWTESGWVNNGSYTLRWKDANGLSFELFSQTVGLDGLLPMAESVE